MKWKQKRAVLSHRKWKESKGIELFDAYSVCLFKNVLTGFKIFWQRSIFFEHSQNFLTVIKSNIVPNKFASLIMVKNIWTHSKILKAFKIFGTQSKYFWTSRWNRHEGENIIVLISDIQVIRKILRKPPENLRLGMISKKR